jgi:hypothetical protein
MTPRITPAGVTPGLGKGVDNGQPGFWVPSTAAPWASTSQALAASRTYVIRFCAPRNATIKRIGFSVSVLAGTNDNCDAGIFSADGTTLLGSAGSTAGKLNATLQPQYLTLLTPVSLVGGAVYYAAFGSGPQGGTAAAVISVTLNTVGNLNAMFGATSPNIEQSFQNVFPLAAPLTTSGAITNAPVLALLET